MNELTTHPYKVYGLKLTKSDSFADSKGVEVWNGINQKTLLGQFVEIQVAINFAENVKNNSPKKSWLITVENSELGTSEEIGYTERENYKGKKSLYTYQK
jgi:hypothetical protein